MPSAKALLFGVLAAMGIAFIAIWARQPRAPGGRVRPTLKQIAIGFVTNFFDTLGIGSFATTTSLYKLGHAVADENIPGTLNVGHMIPTFAEAFIFIAIVEVDMTTLIGMIAASVAGNFIFGALMTLGIGLYAPCMIMVSLLGLNPKAAFPIMMGSCAGLMPMAAARFVKAGRYHPSAAVGLTVGGIPALFIAAYLVKSLPLGAVRWLVIVVVVYTAVTLIRAGLRELSGTPERPVISNPTASVP